MTKFQLSAGELNAFQSILGFLVAGSAFMVAHVSSFPLAYQGAASLGGLIIGYFAADAMAVLKGQTLTAATIIAQGQAVYTPAIQTELQNKIKATVTNPTYQAIALATLAEVDLALSSYVPPSPLAQAVASNPAA